MDDATRKEAAAKAQARWREKQAEYGLCEIAVRIPEEHKGSMKKFSELLRRGYEPGEALEMAFPECLAENKWPEFNELRILIFILRTIQSKLELDQRA